jgi:hypothetical protein
LRPLGNDAIEVTRFSHGQQRATAVLEPGSSEEALLPTLMPATNPNQAAGDIEALARAHFDAGRGLYLVGKFREAVREFEEGYHLKPLPEFLIDLGQASLGLKDSKQAREWFARFLSEAPEDHPSRATIERIIGEIDAAGPTSPPPSVVQEVVPHKRANHRGVIAAATIVSIVVVAAAVGFGVGFGVTRSPHSSLPPYTVPGP